MSEALILSAVRTPIGKFQGALRSLTATDLGKIVVADATARSGIDPAEVDEIIMGNVISAGLGQNPARQAALGGGLPADVAAMTINKVCGSGLKAVGLAAQAIRTDEADTVIAGGMESMTNCPYLLPKARDGYRLGNGTLVDSMIHDGLWDVYEDFHMGCTGEIVAEKYNISRQRQDEYALESQRKAVSASGEGRFRNEIVAVKIPNKKAEAILFDTDECPRPDASLEGLSRLRPVFQEGGTVTAGNAPGLNDGAAALVITSAARAKKLGVASMGRIAGQAVSGIEPRLAMMAPVRAVQKLIGKLGWSIDDIDLIELNEAFSAQAIAVIEQLHLVPDRVNVNGGAVALGHPIGASGARILVTLLHEMARRNARKGLATLCLGGGNAVALAVER